MSKKTKIIILIILCYIISYFLFEVLIGDGNFRRIEKDCEEKGFNTFFPYMTSYMIASLNHFVLVTATAIVCKIIKKLDITYKRIIYTFPIFTLILFYPMTILSMVFARTFHLYGF